MYQENIDMNYNDFDEPAAMESRQYDEIDGNDSQNYEDEHLEELTTCWHQFLKYLRGCWATKHTEDTEKNQELYIKTTLRELLVYIIAEDYATSSPAGVVLAERMQPGN